MVNEEEVVGASATAGEGAHHLHCTAPGMTHVVACGLDDITHSPYTATLTAACSYVSDLGHLCPGCTYDPSEDVGSCGSCGKSCICTLIKCLT